DSNSSAQTASSSEKSTTSSSERRSSPASESASRDERSSTSAARDTRTASTGSDASKSDLVTQLNEASRELAALRAANAKLRAERSNAPSTTAASSMTAAPAARSTPADDKLNQTLRSYTQFKQE